MSKKDSVLLQNYDCPDVTLLPVKEGFSIDHSQKYDLFKTEKKDEIEKSLSETFFIHYYKSSFFKREKHNEEKHIDFWRLETRTPMYRLFQDNCPAVEERIMRALLGQTYDKLV